MTPIVIGVAGGSGSGKTTVVRRIVDSLGDDQVSVLEHDRYYRDRNDLRLEERASLNYDHPDALETDLLVQHVEALKSGAPIEAPVYDFARHARTPNTHLIEPRRALIVEGILIFADAPLRKLMDIKVFVDTDDDTRVIRRLQRDVAERGRTMASVIEQYLSTVKPMHLEFVEPSKRYADIIVPVGGHNAVAVDLLLSLIRSVAGRAAPEPALQLSWRGVRSASDYESSSHRAPTLAPRVRVTRTSAIGDPESVLGRQDTSAEGASDRRDESEPATACHADSTAFRGQGDTLVSARMVGFVATNRVFVPKDERDVVEPLEQSCPSPRVDVECPIEAVGRDALTLEIDRDCGGGRRLGEVHEQRLGGLVDRRGEEPVGDGVAGEDVGK
jgi:uridine kinase